jgi:hypothetical protein
VPESEIDRIPEQELNFSQNIRKLTFAAQNCNSLNVSANCPKQLKKIAALISLSASIIFLSDTRLNSEKILMWETFLKINPTTRILFITIQG